MTAIGGEDVTAAIERSAALLGFEANQTEPPAGNVEFVDYPFTSSETTEDRIEMLERQVRRHQPRIATGPDIEGDVSLQDAVEVGDRLLDAGAETVILVPKDVAPADVPPRFRVGFPASDYGSGASHFITDYADLPAGQGVHLLGGSPTLHLELAEYGMPVVSMDSSSVERVAKKGAVWTADRPHWVKVPDTDLYDRIETSLNNVVAAWRRRAGLDAPETDPHSLPSRPDATTETTTREVRRRNAGRGPPVADPDSGEVGAIEELNATEAEVSAVLDELAAGRAEDAPGSASAIDLTPSVPDDQTTFSEL